MKNEFTSSILMIAVIAIIGALLAVPVVIAEEVKNSEIYIEVDGLIPATDGMHVSSDKPSCTIDITSINAKSVQMKVNNVSVPTPKIVDGKVTISCVYSEGINEIFLSIIDKNGKELECITFFFEAKKKSTY